jgi:hypothetical protein
MKKVAIGLLSLLIVAVTARMGMAQSNVSGDLTGTIYDQAGAAVPGAQVTLKSVNTGATRTTTSNAAGNYRCSLLPPETYVITIQVGGFTAPENLASVSPGRGTVVDVKLTPSSPPELPLDYWYPGLTMYPFPPWPLTQK